MCFIISGHVYDRPTSRLVFSPNQCFFTHFHWMSPAHLLVSSIFQLFRIRWNTSLAITLFSFHIIAALFRAENGGYGTPSFENFSLLLYRWGGNHLRNVFIHGKQCLVLWFRKLRDRGGGPASMKSYSYGVIATKFHATARIISSWHGTARNTEVQNRTP